MALVFSLILNVIRLRVVQLILSLLVLGLVGLLLNLLLLPFLLKAFWRALRPY